MKIASRCLLILAAVVSLRGGARPVGAVGMWAPPGVPPDIRMIFNKPMYRRATWGLRVLDGKSVLVDLNSNHQFLVGSVRKIFSVGELLNAVGASHRYNTPVYRAGVIERGVLHGNLIVVASGDLTMGGRTNLDGTIAVSNWDHNEANSLGNAILTKPDPLAGYKRLASAVRAAGIRRITGNVIVDDRLFSPFLFRDEFYVRPIFVNDDVVDLSVIPGGTVGTIRHVAWRPKSEALHIDDELRTSGPNSPFTLAIKPVLPACIGWPGCASTIAGDLPSNYVPPLTGRPQLVRTVRIVEPSNYARSVFVKSLAATGVSVDASAVQQNPVKLLPPKGSYRSADKIGELTGLPFADDAKLVLKISYNIGADTSLVLFGLTRGVNSIDAALSSEEKNLLSAYGIPRSEYHFVDGSGGGSTAATNIAVTHMLEDLAKGPAAPAFFAALPILGVDGSLAFVKDFQSNPTLAGAIGKVRAKTGTFVAQTPAGLVLKAQALGGYVTSKEGHHLTFQLVVNNVPITGINDVTKVFQDEGTIAAMLWRHF